MTEQRPDESTIPAENGHSAEDVDRLIQQIHDGECDPISLSAEQRRHCVENLSNRAFTTSEIATLLRTSARTVQRDRAVLRDERAVTPDVRLGDQLLGEFERQVETAAARLHRLSHDDACPPYARLWAAEATVRVYRQYLETVHRLGYIEDGRQRLHRQRRREEIARGNPLAKDLARLMGEI
jgi:hypothetical protein